MSKNLLPSLMLAQFVVMKNLRHFLIRQLIEKLKALTYTVLTKRRVVSGRVN